MMILPAVGGGNKQASEAARLLSSLGRHHQAAGEIANVEGPDQQVISHHHGIQRKKEVEINTLIISERKSGVPETVALQQVPYRREIAAVIKGAEAAILLPLGMKITEQAARHMVGYDLVQHREGRELARKGVDQCPAR